MNETIETILNHRSIRKFTDQELSDEQIRIIIQAAQQASTSSYVMAYTIIGVTDPEIKKQLAEVSGQFYVEKNGQLFVFCADLSRIQAIQAQVEEKQVMEENLESTEQFIVATVDAALAAQNAAIAAESLGLGICYLGSLRNDIERVSDILQLPDYVYPLFGMAMGYPNHEPEKKPRFPMEVIYHENTYKKHPEQDKYVQDFDATLKEYYSNRSFNVRSDTWTKQMIRKYKVPQRLDVGPFIKGKQMNRK